MRWPSTVCAARHASMPFILPEPELSTSGCVLYRHYLITGHAIDRYFERIGGDIGNLITDLSGAWLFDAGSPKAPRRFCLTAARHEMDGGYVLCSGNALFMIKPAGSRHIIATTLRMGC